MATWTVTLTARDIAAETVDISATATDEDGTYTFRRGNVYIGTAQAKSAALDDLWNQYVAQKNTESQVATVIGDLESQAKTNLDARTL